MSKAIALPTTYAAIDGAKECFDVTVDHAQTTTPPHPVWLYWGGGGGGGGTLRAILESLKI